MSKKTKSYTIVGDTRLVINALREGEDYNTLVCEGVPIDSAVEWLGRGSEIIIREMPIDKEKWLKYLKKKMTPSKGV